jgi:hypothetical protein
MVETLYRVTFASSGKTEIVSEAELEKLRARGLRMVVEKARIHTCSTCGTSGPWTATWCWFGSYRQIDDDQPILKYCSEACTPPDAPKRAEMEQ